MIGSAIGISGDNDRVTAPFHTLSAGELDAPATADEVATFNALHVARNPIDMDSVPRNLYVRRSPIKRFERIGHAVPHRARPPAFRA